MPGNGLRAYGFHAADREEAARSIQPLPTGSESMAADEGAGGEGLARAYLRNAFSSAELPELTNPTVNGSGSEFALLGVDEPPLKPTRTYRFTQTVDGVPVYGSLVTVELDADGGLVSINSALGAPQGVSSVPSFPPEQAAEGIRHYAGRAEARAEVIRLAYYYDPEGGRWHLAYIGEDVLVAHDAVYDPRSAPVPLADFVIDAHDGRLIATLPRACAADGVDGLNRPRRFETSFDVVTSREVMRDAALNIHTQDFAFRDVGRDFNNLPGAYVAAPPLPWSPAAVSAHANAQVVGSFLHRVLRRRGLDDRGGPMVSSINCVWSAMGSSGRDWPNSFWIKNQVVYGQRASGGGFRSFADALDMVAHEFFHGVTQHSARLDFSGQTGALNESYSDIFGVLIANGLAPDWGAWRWVIGADTGLPLRDMSNPGRFGHPAHMSQYRNLPPGNDSGGIHSNCGIHNRAAFAVMTARDAQGRYLFAPALIAQLFYLALLGLGPTALFADSRRSVELQAQSLLRNDPRRGEKLNAVAEGFASAGI